MGLAAHPANDHYFMRMLEMHVFFFKQKTAYESDLIIAIGARFDDRATGGNFPKFAPNAKIVHIDIDPSTIDKNIRVHCPIVGDAKQILKQMLELIPSNLQIDRREWFGMIEEWGREHPLTYRQNGDKIMTSFLID